MIKETLYTETEIKRISRLQSQIDQEIIKVKGKLISILDSRKYYGLDTNKEKSKKKLKTIVLGQYVVCLRILNDFFKFIKHQSWESDNIGQCFDTDFSQKGVKGPLWYDFIAHQVNILNIECYEGMGIGDCCLFHNKHGGCVLSNFKGPMCAALPDGYMPKSYNYLLVKYLLEGILLGGYDEDKGKYYPYKNRFKVERLLNIIRYHLDELKQSQVYLDQIQFDFLRVNTCL